MHHSGVAARIRHGLFGGSWMCGILAASFVSVGAWALFPDKVAENTCQITLAGAFIATLVTFFLAKIGDKTQIATIGWPLGSNNSTRSLLGRPAV